MFANHAFGQVMGQNLVGNYSFEDHYISDCPNNIDQVPYAIGWRNFCSTPDYYNACATVPGLLVPSNGYGYQQAATGSAYCGFYTFWDTVFGGVPNGRELIGRQLDSSLIIGERYFASFKVSLAEQGSYDYCASNRLGMKFSTVAYDNYGTDSVISPLVNNFAQIYTNNIITDTLNWTTISGSFVADSAYNYLVIANFFDDVHTDTLILAHDTSQAAYCYAYYYLDDVVVMRDTETGIKNDLQKAVNIYSNNSKLFIQTQSMSNARIEIYNLLGQSINTAIVQPFSNYTFDFAGQSGNVYIIKVTSNQDTFTQRVFLSN